MLTKLKETVGYIESRVNIKPQVGIILGTGLGGLAQTIKNQQFIDFKDIPNFPISTVDGHQGRMVFGQLGGKNIVAMQGRFHYYEGYAMQQVTYPVRTMKLLGIDYLIVSNASGGMNPDYEVGDIMIINDHINLMPNPLIGPNISELGRRFPDMSQPYDHSLIALAKDVAGKLKIKVHEGCYVGTTGPTFETPKEYKYFRIIGGDAVGMSTVPEVIVARHMTIPVFGISIITDLGVPGKIVEISHEEVQKVGKESERRMTQIIEDMLQQL